MNQRTQELTAAWLEKARRDLEAALRLIKCENPLSDIGVYHCQQAAEKALKAWLTSRDIVFQKTHDIELLLTQCVPLEPGFNALQMQAGELTPFATEFRYPGDYVEPTPDRALQALKFAEEIYLFCERVIQNNKK